MTGISSTAWGGPTIAWATMRGRCSTSKRRPSWCPKTRRSTTIWVTPTGRPDGSSKHATSGGERCNSGRRRKRSSRSRRSWRMASTRRPQSRTADEDRRIKLTDKPAAPGGRLRLRVLAPAKINLYLHVVGRRSDGYHLLDSLIAFADVGDRLTAEAADRLS